MIDLPELLIDPLPDEAHEALRVATAQAIYDLAEQSVSIGDFRLALRALVTRATATQTALAAVAAERQELRDRVTALEQLVLPTT